MPAGDGIASALLTLEALGGGDLADRDAMQKLPQRLVNVRVADREALEGAQGVWEAVEQEEAALEGRGRVLIRPSGTEPRRPRDGRGARRGECEDVTRAAARCSGVERRNSGASRLDSSCLYVRNRRIRRRPALP